MFSYRHGFHAGNHADVFKHITLIGVLQHLLQKPTPLNVIDTHAGAGVYRLDGDFSDTSGEKDRGIVKLLGDVAAKALPPCEEIAQYVKLLASFNSGNALPQDVRIYPGSPFIALSMLRAQDRMVVCEWHPTEQRHLEKNLAQMDTPASVSSKHADGFATLKSLVPPPAGADNSRRALVLIDPSYELKTDYEQVRLCVADALKRFPTACYAVWYPIVARAEAHQLPKQLKALAAKSGRECVNATFSIGSAQQSGDQFGVDDYGKPLKRNLATHKGLNASGMFIINPPHTLKAYWNNALPPLLQSLGRGVGQGYSVG